ncbi:Major facilitator superfamily domain-containing protein 6-B [Armadillidium vulgare]|nr:Major facilitator superfamily domain-containing protein 6-B [Armadillidium vulgare]
MGISVTVGSIAGIPLLWITSFFINKLGYVNTLVLCCLIYVIRLFGYTIIENPWLVMPFEVLEAFTASLFNVIAISYAETLSSPSTVSSMQGLLGGTYYGLGKSVGSLIGGVMIDILGNTLSYRILAALAGVTGILYFIINILFFRKPKETPVTQIKKPIEVAEFNLDSFRNTKRHAPNNVIKKSKLKGRDNKAFND